VNAREKALDQYAGRGGSALSDGARMIAVLQPLNGDEWNKAAGMPLLDGETGMILVRPKLSYRPPQPDLLICRKGYAFTNTTPIARTAAEQLAANTDQIVRVIETECAAGRRPTKHTLEIMAPSLGRTRREVRDAIVMLLAAGRIAIASIDPPPSNGTRELSPRRLARIEWRSEMNPTIASPSVFRSLASPPPIGRETAANRRPPYLPIPYRHAGEPTANRGEPRCSPELSSLQVRLSPLQGFF
jgi:hypothetical protein